jgi:hypothetical protein
VVETDDHLAIVTEWVTGDPWPQLLQEGWSPQEAAVVALEVGRALESAHRTGITHGRIRPNCIIITDTQEVRLRGLGVDAVLWGTDPEGDPRAADLNGIGAILFAGLTRHWPDEAPIVGFRGVALDNGYTPLPSSLSPDVPAILDRVVGRSLLKAKPSHQYLPFATVQDCVRSLEDAVGQLGGAQGAELQAENTEQTTDRLLGRMGTLAVVLLALAGLGILAFQLTLGRADGLEGEASRAAAYQPLTSPQPRASEGPFPIVSARAIDPGGDNTENSEDVAFAYDRNTDTAWRSESYAVAEIDQGVGIIFDLGAVRPVRAIDLKLTAAGGDFQIATTNRAPNRIKKYRKVVDITGAGEKINVRTPRAINARFVLVKLTRLPYDEGNYVGGLREVRILG